MQGEEESWKLNDRLGEAVLCASCQHLLADLCVALTGDADAQSHGRDLQDLGDQLLTEHRWEVLINQRDVDRCVRLQALKSDEGVFCEENPEAFSLWVLLQLASD